MKQSYEEGNFEASDGLSVRIAAVLDVVASRRAHGRADERGARQRLHCSSRWSAVDIRLFVSCLKQRFILGLSRDFHL